MLRQAGRAEPFRLYTVQYLDVIRADTFDFDYFFIAVMRLRAATAPRSTIDRRSRYGRPKTARPYFRGCGSVGEGANRHESAPPLQPDRSYGRHGRRPD